MTYASSHEKEIPHRSVRHRMEMEMGGVAYGGLCRSGSAPLCILSRGADGCYCPIRNPLGIEGFTNVYKALLYTISPLLYVAVALSVFMRLRRSVGVERQQIK